MDTDSIWFQLNGFRCGSFSPAQHRQIPLSLRIYFKQRETHINEEEEERNKTEFRRALMEVLRHKKWGIGWGFNVLREWVGVSLPGECARKDNF